MIGAAPRPSLRMLAILHADAAVRCVPRMTVVLGAAALTVAVVPLLLMLRWIDFDDDDDRYGDGGSA